MIQPRQPDPAGAAQRLNEIPLRIRVISDAFKRGNEVGKKFPDWRAYQILKFLQYTALYAEDLNSTYQAKRTDSLAQAMRNLLEIHIWTHFCATEPNAKRFFDDAARDMRELFEPMQALYTKVNDKPEQRIAASLTELITRGTNEFGIPEIEAGYTQLNNAAAVVGKQFEHAKFCKAASKFAHPTSLLFSMREPQDDVRSSMYEIGSIAACSCIDNVTKAIQSEFPDFPAL
jgi:hypothetical protein